MSCNIENFSTDIINQTSESITIRITANKLISCASIKVAKYGINGEVLQDFTTVDQLINIPQDITVSLDDSVCKVRVKITKCCEDCDPSTVTCGPGEILDTGSCICIPDTVCAVSDRCEPEPCLWSSTIKGYAYYVENETNLYIPDIGEMKTLAYGGHICDATVFMPKIELSDGTIIEANKYIGLNNWQGNQSPTPVPGFTPQSVYDRSDIFEFYVEDTSVLTDATLFLECGYSNCHNGVIIIALVGYCEELQSHRLVYFGALKPGQILGDAVLSIPCDKDSIIYGPCEPPPPLPSPTVEHICSYISNDYINDCSDGDTPSDPYVNPSDRLLIQSFNEINIPRKFNLNITQDGCDVVAKFCAVGCADPIPPSPSPSPTPTPTPTPSVTPTQTPTPSITPSPCASPSVTPSNTPTRTPTRTPTPTPSASYIPGCQESFTPNIDVSQLKLLSVNNSNILNSLTNINENMCYPCSDPQAPVWVSLLDGNIKGYAYYAHSEESEVIGFYQSRQITSQGSQVPIPNIGIFRSPCWGGHACDRTIFRPKIILDDNSIVLANKKVNLNNLLAFGGTDGSPSAIPVAGFPSVPLLNTLDRSDTFEFNLSPSQLLKLNFAEFFLECDLAECHNGVTAIALVGYLPSLNEYRLIFWSCVKAGISGSRGLFTVIDGTPSSCNPPQTTEDLGVSVSFQDLGSVSVPNLQKRYDFDSRYTNFELYVNKSLGISGVRLPDNRLYELDSNLPNLIGQFSDIDSLRDFVDNLSFFKTSNVFGQKSIIYVPSSVNLIWYIGSYLSPIRGPSNTVYAVIYEA